MLLRLVVLMRLKLCLFRPIDVQGRQLCFVDFVGGNDVGSCSNIYRPIPFKLSMMIDTTKASTFIFKYLEIRVRSHLYEKRSTSVSIF